MPRGRKPKQQEEKKVEKQEEKKVEKQFKWVRVMLPNGMKLKFPAESVKELAGRSFYSENDIIEYVKSKINWSMVNEKAIQYVENVTVSMDDLWKSAIFTVDNKD